MISKTSGYAIRGLAYLALKSTAVNKIGVHELAAELNVPQPFLGKIMQGLVRRDIISSTKGPNGGFFTNERTLTTPIIDVVDAIDGLGMFRRCFLGLPECNSEKPCPLHQHVIGFRDSLQHSLETLTVHDMVRDIEGGLSVLKRLAVLSSTEHP
ncbi:RrF2 family transcriptional regulator [Spirosoma linguale]|uniref:Transcriptional regulator, BadM/Rrf2 family n=1 Tax=Spirosoma linguale (strain ATCC 33905 / DSM 74 / LMG 10896 / Claus 1) TaxID=504472 RepID=D2QR19_SPILD|nr:transcriptional regulator, BadM/Rrf2 family [Spirosoma linguale DSM 74]